MAVVELNPTPPSGNPSFLYSQHRRNLEESRKNFLNQSVVATVPLMSSNQQPQSGLEVGSGGGRRVASKKISFKVKKTASIYRRGGKIGVSSNVAQLASKFNQMNKGVNEENGKVCTLSWVLFVVQWNHNINEIIFFIISKLMSCSTLKLNFSKTVIDRLKLYKSFLVGNLV